MNLLIRQVPGALLSAALFRAVIGVVICDDDDDSVNSVFLHGLHSLYQPLYCYEC